MKDLPDPETYERELKYMPWGKLINHVRNFVIKQTPENGSIIDLMCGPGFLLDSIQKSRPDLHLEGLDISEEFISFAKERTPTIDFHNADVMSFNPPRTYDGIICTGGIHHLPYEDQERIIKKLPGFLKYGGFCILADPCIGEYSNEMERRLAAASLGYDYLKETIQNGATPDIIETALDIMHNDVMGGEFKTSVGRLEATVKGAFQDYYYNKTWGHSKPHGDFWFVARKK